MKIGTKIALTTAAVVTTSIPVASATTAEAATLGEAYLPAPACLTRNTSTVAHKAYLYDGCGRYGSGSDQIMFKFSCIANHPVEITMGRGTSYVYSPGNGSVQIPSSCGVTAWMWMKVPKK